MAQPQFRSRRFCSTDQSPPPAEQFPAITTAKDFSSFVKSPSFDVISNIVTTGEANVPFKNMSDVSVSDFSAGAVAAVDAVTGHIADGGDLADLRDTVSESCLTSLRAALAALSPAQRSLLRIKEEDVFFSWVQLAVVNGRTGLHRIRFAVMSFPRFGEIRRMHESNLRRRELHEEKISAWAAKAGLKGEPMSPPELYRRVKEEEEEMVKSLEDPHAVFRAGDIIISNYEFSQTAEGSWVVSALATRDARATWLWIFHWRWKGRLGFALRGTPFVKVLRFDYATDIFIYFIVLFYVMVSSGGFGAGV